MKQNTITIEQLTAILRAHIGQINVEDIDYSYNDYICNISIKYITNADIDYMLLNLDDDDKKTLIEGLNSCFDKLNKHATKKQINYLKSIGWGVCSGWHIIDIDYDTEWELLHLVIDGDTMYDLVGTESVDYVKLATMLCENIGQIDFEDKHEFVVFYPAVIRDSKLMSALKPIYTESIFVHERNYIRKRLNRCLVHLNNGYAHIAYHVNYVDYKDDRLILTLIATRKDKDKNQ